jgi:hypothetical protein
MNGPNIGHADDPAFIAKEARWAGDIEACHNRFKQAARYLRSLTKEQREQELNRYAAARDEIARLEMSNYLTWKGAQ